METFVYEDQFDSIAEAQRQAKRRLPAAVYLSLVAGTEKGVTLDDNIEAFSELSIVPRVATGPTRREQTASILGQDLSLPVIAASTGVQAVHPDGELAVARATARAGTAMFLSSFASKPVEAVVAANPATFFQIFWMGGRDRVAQLLERARGAGVKGLVITLDWSFAYRRDWTMPAIPERLTVRTAAAFAPQALRHPRWLARYLKNRQLPDLTVPNLTPPGGSVPTLVEAYGEWLQTPLPSWDDLAWLREQWDGPLILKGIMHPNDARRAIEIGADAISVSNHGGNNLDTTPAPIRMLPTITDVVGDQIEVLLDGGIRRGGDVVKSLALGAQGVLVGRVYLWALAAGGEDGIVNALQILRSGIDETLHGLGRDSIGDVVRDDVIVRDGFSPKSPIGAVT